MKKKSILISIIAIVLILFLSKKHFNTVAKTTSFTYPLMPCYYPREWLSGEEDGGTWEVIVEPDGSNLPQFLEGDNPCVPTADCGEYILEYCTDCEDCDNLKLCRQVVWEIPCCDFNTTILCTII